MKIFGRARKDSAAGPLIYLQTLGRAVWTPRQYDQLSQEAYEKNAIAYRCVRLIAEASADVPWVVYEGDRELEDHLLLTLLKKPNPFECGSALWEYFYSFLQLAGNAYLEAVVLDGVVRELFILRPDRMKVRVGRRGYPSKYIYTVNQQSTEYDVDVSPGAQLPILHMKMFHPTNDHYGMSPVEAGAFSIDVHNQAGTFNQALLQNMARPSGALVYSGGKDGKGTLSQEQYTRLKSEMNEKYSGERNAGKPILLEGGLDWKEMGLNPKDLEFIEGKREAAREIALAFGVPPMLLGIPGDNTYSNYAEANRVFYRQTVLPLVGKTAQALSNFFRPTFGEDFKLWYNIDEIPALAIEREAVWEKVQTADWLTVNEKREATGYDEYTPGDDPGDQIYTNASMVPLDELGLLPGGAEPDE